MAQGFPVGHMGPMAPWSTGGIAVHVAELVKVLSRDHPVRVVTPGPRGGVHRTGGTEVKVARRFPVTPLPPFEFLPEFQASLGFLREAAILHSHDPRLSLVVKFLRKPLVVTFHGYLTLEAIVNAHTRPGRPLYEFYDRIVRTNVEVAARLIAVDRRIADWLQRSYSAASVDVIPNGVDTSRFRPGLDGRVVREALGIPVAAPLVLGAKHFVPKNGLDVLVRAMPHVRRDVPDAALLLAGSGDLEPLIRRLVRNLGLESCTYLPGQIPHDRMPSALAACDVCVVPSVPVAGVEEATSILALEAMASGKAVIASDLGGLREIIEHGATGLLVPAGDPESLGASIARVLLEPDRRNALGTRARSHVGSHHAWSSVADRVRSVYREVLGRGDAG